MTVAERFAEPSDEKSAVGAGEVRRQLFPYERYITGEGIPVYEEFGVRDVRELDLVRWDRRGVRGAFIVLDQVQDMTGVFVLGLAPGEWTEPERHVYEERYVVVEGEAILELFDPHTDTTRSFDWHTGGMFAIPINTRYRLANAGRDRLVVVSLNTAPPIINRYENLAFVFDNGAAFDNRYAGEADYYATETTVLSTKELGRAMWRTNGIENVVSGELPADHQRSPGYRRVELPDMAGGNFWGFVGEYGPGHYSSAHAHGAGDVFVCVRGQGYTLAWSTRLGTTPWAAGRGEEIERVDYRAGGLFTPVPGAGDWYHQHFSTGMDPLRFVVAQGGLPGGPYQAFGGRTGNDVSVNAPIGEGGRTIRYADEDPYVRGLYERELSANGLRCAMPPVV